MKQFPVWILTTCTALAGAPNAASSGASPADRAAEIRWLTAGDALRTASAANFSRMLQPGADGRLVYSADQDGLAIPDFSTCGYLGGGAPLPQLPVRVTLRPSAGGEDDRPRIQAAIDQVSQLPADARGFRGAVLLERGSYRVHGTLRISTGGVVLRGAGAGENGTVLTATLPKKHTVIEVGGTGGPKLEEASRQRITDARVPAGARSFRVANAAAFKVGDRVIVHRPSTREWIVELGMDRLTDSPKPGVKNWSPGGFDLRHDRTITAIDGAVLTLDAPVFQTIEDRFGGGTVVRYRDPDRIEHVGVEDLRIVSIFDRTKFKPIAGVTPAQAVRQFEDEDHAWIGVVLDRLRHGWVSRVTVVNAGYSAVHCQYGAVFTTVQDCAMIDPISQHTGGRKYCFGANGQFGLFLRCYARNGRHDFVLGARVAGPNVFLDCLADEASSASEPHHRYGTGCLWDNVRLRGDAELQAVNRWDSGSGHGWAGANNVFWNCEATVIFAMKPPTAQNWAIGWIGGTDAATLNVGGRFRSKLERLSERAPKPVVDPGVPILGDGYIESPTAPVAPRSLYLRQLEERLGPGAVRHLVLGTGGPAL